MGLKERRAQQAFVEGHFPKLQERVQGAAKFPVEVEVDWTSLAIPERSHLYEECWPVVYFEPLVNALENLTSDEMGAEAIKESLKKIVVQNQSGNSNGHRWATFESGVLTLDHEPTTNTTDVEKRGTAVQSLLEDSL